MGSVSLNTHISLTQHPSQQLVGVFFWFYVLVDDYRVSMNTFFYPFQRMLTTTERWLLVGIVCCLVVIVVAIVGVLIQARREHKNCQRCKYDLRACSDGTCSECGLQQASRFRYKYWRPYFGVTALLIMIGLSFIMRWPRVWIGLRIMTGNDVVVNKEIDLGHDVIVQDCKFIVQGSDGYGYWDRSVRVVRSGEIIYDKWLFSSAEYYKIEDLNGNGTLDFRYGYGCQGSGRYCHSEIIDPLYDEVYEVDAEHFKDINDDGIKECFDRDDRLLYTWTPNVDRLNVYVTKTWDKKYGEHRGWQLSTELTRQPAPNNESVREVVFNVRERVQESIESKGSTYLGCIAQAMANYCYTGHPNLAFQLLDSVWLESDEKKLAFEREFVEELREAEFVVLTVAFGVFDEAGKRACERGE